MVKVRDKCTVNISNEMVFTDFRIRVTHFWFECEGLQDSIKPGDMCWQPRAPGDFVCLFFFFPLLSTHGENS